MGSPEDEAERYDNEDQHEVALTKGLWLADTACTQHLWEAVMGSNPSRFTDDPTLPVERVSWEEVQVFVTRLNRVIDGLSARLPTEAEWEYACRAGSVTPFSFGESITSEDVNYNGTYPYATGANSKYRERTVTVKSLPANAWGLYEMPGNVWEWCSDWFAPYPQGTAVNPTGPAHQPSDDARPVVRGGSWFARARHTRSACRGAVPPGDRDNGVGFRFALDQ